MARVPTLGLAALLGIALADPFFGDQIFEGMLDGGAGMQRYPLQSSSTSSFSSSSVTRISNGEVHQSSFQTRRQSASNGQGTKSRSAARLCVDGNCGVKALQAKAPAVPRALLSLGTHRPVFVEGFQTGAMQEGSPLDERMTDFLGMDSPRLGGFGRFSPRTEQLLRLHSPRAARLLGIDRPQLEELMDIDRPQEDWMDRDRPQEDDFVDMPNLGVDRDELLEEEEQPTEDFLEEARSQDRVAANPASFARRRRRSGQENASRSGTPSVTMDSAKRLLERIRADLGSKEDMGSKADPRQPQLGQGVAMKKGNEHLESAHKAPARPADTDEVVNKSSKSSQAVELMDSQRDIDYPETLERNREAQAERIRRIHAALDQKEKGLRAMELRGLPKELDKIAKEKIHRIREELDSNERDFQAEAAAERVAEDAAVAAASEV